MPSRQQVAFGDREVIEHKVKEAVIVPEFDPEFHHDALRKY
jgi:hypothetical protein